MIGNRFTAWIIAFAVAAGASQFASAAEDESPRSPIKVETIDYVKESEGAGTFKLAGIAIAGSEVYIFVDDKPLARVVAGDDGKWSVEETTELGAEVHTVRVEQYDNETRMLAARAMFKIEVKPEASDDTKP